MKLKPIRMITSKVNTLQRSINQNRKVSKLNTTDDKYTSYIYGTKDFEEEEDITCGITEDVENYLSKLRKIYMYIIDFKWCWSVTIL